MQYKLRVVTILDFEHLETVSGINVHHALSGDSFSLNANRLGAFRILDSRQFAFGYVLSFDCASAGEITLLLSSARENAAGNAYAHSVMLKSKCVRGINIFKLPAVLDCTYVEMLCTAAANIVELSRITYAELGNYAVLSDVHAVTFATAVPSGVRHCQHGTQLPKGFTQINVNNITTAFYSFAFSGAEYEVHHDMRDFSCTGSVYVADYSAKFLNGVCVTAQSQLHVNVQKFENPAIEFRARSNAGNTILI